MDWHTRYVQQARWTAELRNYLFQRAGISKARRLLEVGCGTGAILVNLISSLTLPDRKSRKPGIEIHGLDINPTYLFQAARHAPTVRFATGDAHCLPYASNAFDTVFCHFLLLWVTDPAQALAEMVRVARPGGCILALAEPDYGGRIDYPESLVGSGALQESALRKLGVDTRLGRRLRALFHQAGLSKIEAGVIGGQWQDSPSEMESEQEWQTLESDLDGMLSADELDKLKRLEDESRNRGERILFVPTFYTWGEKK
jgi:SAM-dependent methyltransferase